MSGGEPHAKPLGVKLGIAVIALYFGATLFVGVRNYRLAHGDRPEWVAARDLRRNHRITSVDLVLPPAIKGTPQEWLLPPVESIEGKYLTEKVAKGASIDLSSVMPEPEVSIAPGFTTVPIEIPTSLPSNAVDAETVVDVMSDGKTIASQVRVVAVRCTATPPCVALVRLPQAAAAKLGKETSLTVVADASEGTMNARQWTKIAEVDVSSRPSGVWTPALDYVAAETVLKLEASGSWQYGTDPAKTCTPDGDPTTAASGPFAGALLGALIGRFGGSTAGVVVANDSAFAVGSLAIVIPAAAGPLYLTINQKPADFPPAPAKLMKVTISRLDP